MAKESRLRVLFVINDLARAGAETQLVEIASALDPARYHRAIVILKEKNDFAERLSLAGIEVFSLRRRGWWDAGVPVRLWRLLLSWRPDVIHSFLFLANTMSAPVARLAGVPAVVLSQRCSYEATLPFHWRLLARWTHRLADRVIVNSRAALEEEHRAGADPRRTVHVPNGVALVPGPAPSRGDLGLPEGPLVVCLGQLETVKGHRFLLAAWPEVLREHPDAHLVLVGDGALRANLEAQVRAEGVDGSVRFLGFRPNGRLYAAAADVVVQPSLTEGMPNAVLEAMAAGRAVVASRVGGMPELLQDGETGFLVPPARSSELSKAVVHLLSDPSLAARYGQAAARHVGDRHRLTMVTAAVETLYRESRRSG